MSGSLAYWVAASTGGSTGTGLATARRFVAVFISGRRQAELAGPDHG